MKLIDQDTYQHSSGYIAYIAEDGQNWCVMHPSNDNEIMFPSKEDAFAAIESGDPDLPANLGGTWIN